MALQGSLYGKMVKKGSTRAFTLWSTARRQACSLTLWSSAPIQAFFIVLRYKSLCGVNLDVKFKINLIPLIHLSWSTSLM